MSLRVTFQRRVESPLLFSEARTGGRIDVGRIHGAQQEAGVGEPDVARADVGRTVPVDVFTMASPVGERKVVLGVGSGVISPVTQLSTKFEGVVPLYPGQAMDLNCIKRLSTRSGGPRGWVACPAYGIGIHSILICDSYPTVLIGAGPCNRCTHSESFEGISARSVPRCPALWCSGVSDPDLSPWNPVRDRRILYMLSRQGA